jgi:hypothetical protein
MGILDDAIREHLDLKRRAGADPTEIDRLEREALGPVRRVPHDTPDSLIDEASPQAGYVLEEDEFGLADSRAAPAWSDAADEPVPFDHEPEVELDGSPTEHWPAPAPADQFQDLPEAGYEDEPPVSQEPRGDLPRHHEIAEEWEAHERRSLGEPAGREPDFPAPAPPPSSADAVFGDEPRQPMPADFDEETAEYEVEIDQDGEASRSEPDEGEDMLEETPDFLQDTPDHDRLWFEQRPPRDFDFDG